MAPLAGSILARNRSKQYILPETELYPLTETILKYFGARKISPSTLEAYRIQGDVNGNIVFPFYRNETMEFVKFRRPRKPEPGEPKEWQAKGACPILFGMDQCVFSKPLIVTEGQIDALSLFEAGLENVVSVPSGAENLEWIRTCWDWLDRFNTIVLFGDNDAPGKRMVQSVARRLDEARCMLENGLCMTTPA